MVRRLHFSFCGAENNINGAAGKKFWVRCKNLASDEHFFAEQKMKNGAAGKNKLGVQPWTVQDFVVNFFFLAP